MSETNDMTNEPLIKRVARAIMTVRGGCHVVDWAEAQWNPAVDLALAEARAAIEAMRDPTPYMCAAALDDRIGGPAPMFNAMIIAALEEGP